MSRATGPHPSGDPWMRRIAWLMDSSIPLGRRTIGLDPLIGLVPGLGDLAGGLISMLIVARAVSAGIPRVAIARMISNIAIDSILGSVPVLGDLFDFAHKANWKNVRIYEQTVYGGRRAELRHWGFFAALAGALIAVLAVLAALVLALAQALVSALGFRLI